VQPLSSVPPSTPPSISFSIRTTAQSAGFSAQIARATCPTKTVSPNGKRAHLHFLSHNGSIKALVVRGGVWPKYPKSTPVSFLMAVFADYFAFFFGSAGSSSADSRASSFPQHRSQGTQWPNHGHDSAIPLWITDTSSTTAEYMSRLRLHLAPHHCRPSSLCK
jgi:hypothetical protein